MSITLKSFLIPLSNLFLLPLLMTTSHSPSTTDRSEAGPRQDPTFSLTTHRSQQTFPVKGQTVNILGLEVLTVSVAMIQICCCSTKEARDKIEMMGVAEFQQRFLSGHSQTASSPTPAPLSTLSPFTASSTPWQVLPFFQGVTAIPS